MRSIKFRFLNLIIFSLLLIDNSYATLGKQAKPEQNDPTETDKCSEWTPDMVTLNAKHKPEGVPTRESAHSSLTGAVAGVKKWCVRTFGSDYRAFFEDDYGYGEGRYRFGFDQEERGALVHPNQLFQLKYNGLLLEFDELCQLPTHRTIYVTVYTNDNGIPILLDFSGLFEHTFFGLDKKSKRWTNEELKGITGSKCPVKCVQKCSKKGLDRLDENGVRFYVVKSANDYPLYYKALYKKLKGLTKKYSGRQTFKVDSEEPALQVTLLWLRSDPLTTKKEAKKPDPPTEGESETGENEDKEAQASASKQD